MADTTVQSSSKPIEVDTVESLRMKLNISRNRYHNVLRMLTGVLDAIDEAQASEESDVTGIYLRIERVPDLTRWWKEHKTTDATRVRADAIHSREVELGRISDRIRKIKALDGLVPKTMIEKRNALMDELRVLRMAT